MYGYVRYDYVLPSRALHALVEGLGLLVVKELLRANGAAVLG